MPPSMGHEGSLNRLMNMKMMCCGPHSLEVQVKFSEEMLLVQQLNQNFEQVSVNSNSQNRAVGQVNREMPPEMVAQPINPLRFVTLSNPPCSRAPALYHYQRVERIQREQRVHELERETIRDRERV